LNQHGAAMKQEIAVTPNNLIIKLSGLQAKQKSST
jgi:hypothetical protein